MRNSIHIFMECVYVCVGDTKVSNRFDDTQHTIYIYIYGFSLSFGRIVVNLLCPPIKSGSTIVVLLGSYVVVLST